MGFYWKYDNNDTLYWSNSLYIFYKDITFTSVDNFFQHKIKNNFKKNFDNIHIRKNEEFYNRNPDSHLIELRNKGCYWRYKDDKYIFWSNCKLKLTKDKIFHSAKDFLEDKKKKLSFPDFSDIKIIEKPSGTYWKFDFNDTIFWSYSINILDKDIIFGSEEELNKNIKDNNNDLNIKIIKNYRNDAERIIYENIFNKNDDIKNIKDLGCYWKYENGDGTIFWSNSKNFNKDIIFNSSSKYFNHRKKLNFK